MQKRLGLDLKIPNEFGWMIGGYTVGEANFLATIRVNRKDGQRQLQLRYQIKVRDDDGPGLEYIRDTLGVGRINSQKAQRETWHPQTIYWVYRLPDLYHVIVPLFEKYPLPHQWRKAREFEIWKQLVAIAYLEGGSRNAPLGRSYWGKVTPLVEELKRIRAYSPPS